ncbi:hypothetical protein OROGR_022965 [Orobanche gracilis]
MQFSKQFSFWIIRKQPLCVNTGVFMESCHHLLDFLKRSNVVSPTVALEKATALQFIRSRKPHAEHKSNFKWCWKSKAGKIPFEYLSSIRLRSNVVSPAVALETATALQHKIEKATRRAQEQFQMVLEEQSR